MNKASAANEASKETTATTTTTTATTDTAERRRVQNRLAQRNYQRNTGSNVKQRLRQLEWLDSILLDGTAQLPHKPTSMALQPTNPVTPPLQWAPSVPWPHLTDTSQQTADPNAYMFIPATQGFDASQMPCFNALPDLQPQDRVNDLRGAMSTAVISTPSDKSTEGLSHLRHDLDPTQGNSMGPIADPHSMYQNIPNDEKDANQKVQSPSAVFRAASHGHTRIVKILLDKGARLETRDAYGQTLLHVACSRGFDALVSLLIEEGIDLNAKDDFGCTPLQIAAERGLEGTVELLVNAGALIDVVHT
ncbi:hypothetical protein PVAG01_00539 [Phlyctema vagabunda]|uniref:BZIP domain-containing protein n=1 Tax=Phlyctema vagabunda TaxID=108571 RepID=A0ABR4PUI5_9HELO